MKKDNTKELRASLAEYSKPSDKTALFIFGLDVFVYIAAIAGVILFESMALRLMCGLLAGFKISSLFIIGHDASHNAFTSSKKLNGIIARIVFLPSLHNYALWLVEHNRIHHQATNIKNMDSWSPLSKEEYEALPNWRKIVEKFYRSPFGMGFYYMIERWWKNKFYPFKSIKGKYNSVNFDFALVVTYFISYIASLIYLGSVMAHTTSLELVMIGFVGPFMIWNFMMGFTVYQHHTHESIAWNKTRKDREKIGGQDVFTMHVKYPNWYNKVSYNIMVHTAHHVDPRIPLYKLDKAQLKLSELIGKDIKVIDFSFKTFWMTMAKCKLYDYENNVWLDFNGQITARPYAVETKTLSAVA